MPATTRTGGVRAPPRASPPDLRQNKREAERNKRAAAEVKAAEKAAKVAAHKAQKKKDAADVVAAAAARAARAADLKPRAINKFVYAVLALVAATAARGVALKAAADARGRGLKPDMFAGMTGGVRAASAGAGVTEESAVRASAARPAAPAQVSGGH
jgi:hypothetical protein